MSIRFVMDAPAALAYARGDLSVGEQLARAAAAGEVVLLPATCLTSAYCEVPGDAWNMLNVLVNLEPVVIDPLTKDDCAITGGWARTLGLPTAHAAITAAAHAVVPIMTDQGDLIHEFLPKEWPIIEI